MKVGLVDSLDCWEEEGGKRVKNDPKACHQLREREAVREMGLVRSDGQFRFCAVESELALRHLSGWWEWLASS